MILRYAIKQGDMLEENNVIFLLERGGLPSQYWGRVVESCVKQEDLNEFIFSYKRNEKQTVLLAVLGDDLDTEKYFNIITSHFYEVYRRIGRKVSVYLPSVNNFRELAQAVALFCQKNFSYNYDFKFFCEDDKRPILEEMFRELDTMFLNRKNEVSEFLYGAFNCYYCKNFAYNPCILACCNLVICSNCSKHKKTCPVCFSNLETGELSKFANLFSKAPYYCLCGLKIEYSQKFEHCKTCEVAWFNCKFCNKSLNYASSLEHFKEFHVVNLMLDKLF